MFTEYEQNVLGEAVLIIQEKMRAPVVDRNVTHGLALQAAAIKYGAQSKEMFGVMFFGQNQRLISFETLFVGEVDACQVYPRAVVESVISREAYSVILVHNHPGGSIKPSDSDIDVTDDLRMLLGIMGVPVLDHIIVAGDMAFSMKSGGYFDSDISPS